MGERQFCGETAAYVLPRSQFVLLCVQGGLDVISFVICKHSAKLFLDSSIRFDEGIEVGCRLEVMQGRDTFSSGAALRLNIIRVLIIQCYFFAYILISLIRVVFFKVVLVTF